MLRTLIFVSFEIVTDANNSVTNATQCGLIHGPGGQSTNRMAPASGQLGQIFSADERPGVYHQALHDLFRRLDRTDGCYAGACREAHRKRFRRHLEAASREPLLRHDKLLRELANVTSLDWSETQRTLLFSRYAGSAIHLLQR
jgi:hypothetical protein